MTGSNRRPSACKADALPAELTLHDAQDVRVSPTPQDVAVVEDEMNDDPPGTRILECT
jgi:hypothetical protein